MSPSPTARKIPRLPVPYPAVAWSAAAAVGAVYVATMGRDLSLYDSAELALAAHVLGLSHPIGQPLHTLLGALFARLPGLPPLVGLNLLSALFGALAVVPAYSIAMSMVERPSRSAAALVGLVLAVCGLHWTLWEPATRVEIYSLAVCCALFAIAHGAAALGTDRPQPRRWLMVGIWLGLAAACHSAIAVIAALSLAPPMLLRFRATLSPRVLGALVLGGCLPLLLYLYVPLVASRAPDHFVWGVGPDLAGLGDYFGAADYRHNRTTGGAEFLDHLGRWGAWTIDAGVQPILFVGAVAWLGLGLRRPLGPAPASVSLALVAAVLAYNTVFHPEVLDYLGYLSLPLWLCAAGLGALATLLVGERHSDRGSGFWFAALGVSAPVMVAAMVFTSSPGPHERTRRLDFATRIIAEGALADTPERGVLVAEHDHLVAALLYLQEAEGARPDVVVLAYGLASSEWYWHHLHARQPTLESFELRAAGGRSARVRRFLAANGGRAVRVETHGLAEEIGERPCAVGWVIAVGGACGGLADADSVTGRLAAIRDTLGRGSPGTEEVLAHVAMARGEALWRLGLGAQAFQAFLAGAVQEASSHLAEAASLAGAPPLRGPLPPWQRPAAVADPDRNLFMASRLADAGAKPVLRDALTALARERGLPEAF